MIPIDTDSIVFTEDAPKTEAKPGQAPQALKTITPPIDYDSIKFNDEEPAPKQKSKLPQMLTNIFSPPALGVARIAGDLGAVDYKLTPDAEKDGHISQISDISGLPHDEISKHYETFKFLAGLSSPAQAGFEIGKQVDPVTTKGIVDATMTPAIVAAAVANPVGTAAGLIAFTALDHIIPTDKFIPEDATDNQRASIELIGMVAKGAVIGGLFHSAESKVDMKDVFDFNDMPMGELLQKHTFEKLLDKGLPTSIEISPAQLAKLDKIQRKNTARMEQGIATIQKELVTGKEAPVGYAPELVIEAKRRAVESMKANVPSKGPKREAHYDIIRKLENELKEATKQPVQTTPEQAKTGQEQTLQGPSVTEAFGIDAQTVQTAINNNLNVKVNAEKLIKVAVDSEADFIKVKEILSEQKAIEGTGETKTRGLSQGVEAKAVEKKLTDGFGSLPEYQVVNMKDQALKASELASKDYEMAKRVAMGQEPAPAELLPESVFMAVENKAILEGDTATLRELATASKLTTEATTMGQRIRTLAERDPESPTGAIKDVLKTREEAAQKRLGKKKTLAKEVQKVANEIKKELSKVRQTKQTWADFILSIQC